MAVACIATVCFCVTVVEAAGAVEVGTVEDRVHALGRVACRRAVGGVVAVAAARRHEDAIHLAIVQRDRSTSRAGEVVEPIGFRSAKTAGWGLGEVITATGLVVNDRDDAGRLGTEAVLGGGVGDTASRQRCNVGRCIVGATLHLVEDAAVTVVQSASGAVRGDARSAAGGVDVAGPSGDKGGRGNKH